MKTAHRIHPLQAQPPATAEARARVDLAAAFRWAARCDFHEGVANHFSVAVSDDGARFLINPCGRHFSTLCAGDLLLVDAHDRATMDRADAPDPTAWAIHGAMHRNLPHARCVLHVHPTYATVVASLQDSDIPPIDQNTMRFYRRVAVDDGFQGMGLDDEAERITTQLADKSILMMGNHGVMVCAGSVAQAFDELYYLERACRTLVLAYTTGRPLRRVSDEVARTTCEQWIACANHDQHLAEIKGILDREAPDYRE